MDINKIKKVMDKDVWDLLYDIVEPDERVMIKVWIDDFMERNPYDKGGVDKYFRKAGDYFKQVIPNKRKIASLSMGIGEIIKSLDLDDVVDDSTGNSIYGKMEGIVDRMERLKKK